MGGGRNTVILMFNNYGHKIKNYKIMNNNNKNNTIEEINKTIYF